MTQEPHPVPEWSRSSIPPACPGPQSTPPAGGLSAVADRFKECCRTRAQPVTFLKYCRFLQGTRAHPATKVRLRRRAKPARQQRRIGHPMDDFLVRWAKRRERTRKLRAAADDEVVGA